MGMWDFWLGGGDMGFLAGGGELRRYGIFKVGAHCVRVVVQ